MANDNTLWFEMGVRDNVSQVLDRLLKQAEQLGIELDRAKLNENLVRNAENLERVYDRIAVAVDRIHESRTKTTDRKELNSLKDMENHLNKMLKKFQKFENSTDMVSKSGTAAFQRLVNQFQLAMEQVSRYTNEIDKENAIDQRNKAAEAKRIDELTDKYNELYRLRRQMQDAFMNASPTTDTTEAMKIMNSLAARMGAIKRSQSSGNGIPNSVLGADYEEFLRRVKEVMFGLTSATSEYNTKLRENESIRKNLTRIKLDTESQNTVAQINKQTYAYTALANKLSAVSTLLAQVEAEEQELANGTKTNPQYTRDEVAKRLEAIQRQYNIDLAQGKDLERQDAEAKDRNAAASKKAADALQMLNHVNQGLITSYNRIAEAGSKAHNITIQFQNQLANYAGLYGLERMLKSIITIGGQFEYQHMALQNILGDVQEANVLFAQLQDLAIESPKTFMELTSYAKQLSAYQIPVNELFDTTKRLADMSSGLGVDMSRLILAYGQVRSAAVLRGQELRQFTEAGIPMVQALADKFTELNGKLTTTADVFKLISARKVPFEMVKEVMWDMTNQGGQFYNMQAELADTLYGKWQKLQDQWQITLGHIADGASVTGKMLKWLLEMTVQLASAFDTLTPLLSMFGITLAGKSIFNMVSERVNAKNGNAAIKRMELAMQKEIARLERERILYGKQLNAEEQKLVKTKGVLRSQEYYLLAIENQIDQKKTHQLYLEGKLKASEYQRYLIMQGYTAQQTKQILHNNTQIMQQKSLMDKLKGSSAWNFIGGWWGAGLMAMGAVLSALSALSQKNEELSMKGESMMSHAQQGVNSLSKVLDASEGNDSTEKKIEALEDALLNLGRTGEAIVAESRENMDDIEKRWDSLKKGAENYKQVLDALGNQEGKAVFEQLLDKSDIEDYMKAYDDAVNEMFKKQTLIEKYDEVFKKAIKSIVGNNKEMMEALSGKDLYKQIETIGQKKLYDELFLNNKNKYGQISASAISALNAYFNSLVRVENKWKDITEESIPKMAEALRTEARKLGIEDFNNLTPDQKDKLESLSREIAKAIQNGSKEGKDRLAQELANQVFRIKIVADFSVDTTKMSSFAAYIWERFGKGGALGDKGNVRIGNSVFNKAQVATVFDDIDQYDKESSQAILKLQKTKKKLEKLTGTAGQVKDIEKQINDKLAERRAVGLDDPKEKGGTGGTKTDPLLETWKARISLLEKYRKDLEDLEKYMTRSQAEKKLREDKNYNSLFSYLNPNDYIGSINKAIKELGTKGDRGKYVGELGSKKSAEGIRVLKDNAKDAVSELQRLLDVMSENYQTYKKWIELTGDKALAARVAGVTQNSSYSDLLTDLMKKELDKTNLALNPADIFGLKESDAKKLGENSGIFDLWKAWQDNQKKLKKESWDMFENSIKNAKDYKDEIDDLNRELKLTLDNIDEITKTDKDGGKRREKLRQSATDKTTEKINQKMFEQFKKDSDWNKIFEDLDNVTYETITTLIEKMREFGAQATIDAKNTKEWVDAWNKLQDAAVNRNPFGALMSMMSTNSEIKSLLNSNKNQDSFVLSREQASRFGLKVNKNDTYSRRELNDASRGINRRSGIAWSALAKDFKELQNALQPVIDLFDALGNKTLSDIFKAGNNALGSAANTAGAFSSLSKSATDAGLGGIGTFLQNAGPYAAIASAALSVVSTAIGMFGADYSDYNNMKEQYEGLIDVWDDLIDRKKEYLNESWGTEAKQAGKEALELYKSEIEQTKVIAESRLGSGSSWGSHSIGYRMWEGSYGYNGKNWIDVADEISRNLGGVRFKGMEDMLNMTSEQLIWIKTNYSGLWAHMDSDFKDYLEKLIKYGDSQKELLNDLQKKLTGMDYDEMVSSYGSALSQMENDNKALGENLEDTLKDAILNAMVANVYGERIKSLIKKTKELGENDDKVYENGKILSEYTADEYAIIKAEGDALNRDMEESRDRLKKMYGWTDDSSKDSTSSIGKAITEQDSSLWSSYLNAIRLDVSVQRVVLEKMLAEVQKGVDIPESVMSQLRHLEEIAGYTKRSADAAEAISKLLKGVAPDGTYVKIK